jgi:oxygen-independent coproporphyrinogen-3 oxidase
MPALTDTTDGVGFGVYVHWPFCASKCPYCDFNSHVRHEAIDEGRYIAAYLHEINWQFERAGPRRTGSVFFGGGTPSLMHPSKVARLLEAIDRRWPIEPGAEITLEANPSSVEAGRFAGYRAAGVNRVSLGVQSLRDSELRLLGRLHDAAEARAAIATAQATFERSSFDLIYARPGQTAAAWKAELKEALALARGHLSLYQLTIEPSTPFAALHGAGKLVLPPDEAARDLYAITQEMTAAAGLPAYEISNHAAPGEESRHNLLYWRYGEYAGLGAGAHGRLVLAGRRHELASERNPEAWLEAVEAGGHAFRVMTELSLDEQADEMLLMGLRIAEGLDLGRLERRTGRAVATRAVDDLLAAGMIEVRAKSAGRPARIAATRAGRMVLNAVVERLARSMGPVATPEATTGSRKG